MCIFQIILWAATTLHTDAPHYEDELNWKISKWLTRKQENNGRLRKELVQKITENIFSGRSLPRRGWRLQARVSHFWCVSNAHTKLLHHILLIFKEALKHFFSQNNWHYLFQVHHVDLLLHLLLPPLLLHLQLPLLSLHPRLTSPQVQLCSNILSTYGNILQTFGNILSTWEGKSWLLLLRDVYDPDEHTQVSNKSYSVEEN